MIHAINIIEMFLDIIAEKNVKTPFVYFDVFINNI